MFHNSIIKLLILQTILVAYLSYTSSVSAAPILAKKGWTCFTGEDGDPECY
ncbi:uncharacterized protein FA14DRAFT_189761 [Meira miltonrushii]|uniref:Uncharacterized protein n=1 Tax=Meira miltonrushii TaxID=1280837 RepID=A0A316VE25_9BASI|nr:uncharacterized protein FA14DRAFT_189761 [Meira miltonrushii]PWN35822.1 hypothetical protein FA14DRAFT_189761 [Meira miltonrushii]